MTDKQKKAVMTINALFEHCGEKVFTYDEYFLLLDFVVGIPEPIINMPFQRTEPYYPNGTWITTTPFDPQRNYEPDGRFGKVTCTDTDEPIRASATSITDTMKAKDKELSYGEKLIKEGRSPCGNKILFGEFNKNL